MHMHLLQCNDQKEEERGITVANCNQYLFYKLVINNKLVFTQEKYPESKLFGPLANKDCQ